MTRSFPDRPVVGVGAVVLDDDNRVLLVKRAHEPLKGEWSLPGGAVELGETLEAAVLREILEETGLIIDIGAVVEIFERVDRTPDDRVQYHFVIVDYVCYARAGSPVRGSDAADVRWVTRAELAGYRITEKATSVIDKALSLAVSTEDRPARRATR